MSEVKQDWFERQIQAIAQCLAALLFGKDKVKKVLKKLKEEQKSGETQKMDDMLLDVIVDQYLNRGEFSEAEETLFSFMENGATLHIFMKSMLFYDRLLAMDDEELKQSGFSKERINEGIKRLKKIYDV